MNKKVFIAGVALLFLICAGLIFVQYKMENAVYDASDEKCIKQFFGISKSKYEYDVIRVENTLKKRAYIGTYKAWINIDEEKMSEFAAELKNNYYMSIEDINDKNNDIKFWEDEDGFWFIGRKDTEDEEDNYFIGNMEIGIEVDEIQSVAYEMCGLLREIPDPEGWTKHPKDRLVICCKPVDGVCRIFLEYTE